LDESAYRAIGSSEKEINELIARSRSAVSVCPPPSLATLFVRSSYE
jgi:hypothetical protein